MKNVDSNYEKVFTFLLNTTQVYVSLFWKLIVNKIPTLQAMCFTSSKINRVRRTQEMWRGRCFLDVDIRRTGRNHHNFFVSWNEKKKKRSIYEPYSRFHLSVVKPKPE